MTATQIRPLAEAAVLLLMAAAQFWIGRRFLALDFIRGSQGRTRAARILILIAAVWLTAGMLLTFPNLYTRFHFPDWCRTYISGPAILWLFSSTMAVAGYGFFERLSRLWAPTPFSPRRRLILRTSGATVAAAPFLVTGFGAFIGRTNFQVREIDVPIPDLAPSLHGLRLVQISDIHLSPYLSESDLAGVIDASNELRPHVALVTGDLISVASDPLDACLRQLARLRTGGGILGCLGNHEVYARCERYTTERGASLGIRFLRGQNAVLNFGSAALNIVGVDYQPIAQKSNYLAGSGRLIVPGACNILLSHNPDVFPVAARQGFDLTVAGHTHGGQVTFEILEQTLNFARFVTPYVYGSYQSGRSSLYVTRGIGTIGLPARIGASPEIALLRLVPSPRSAPSAS
ncbi:MAG: metallophosphoesterase [Bryobacteraceae bacterium]